MPSVDTETVHNDLCGVDRGKDERNMSRKEEDNPNDTSGHQRRISQEVDEIVKRLSTPKKSIENKRTERRTKVCLVGHV